MIICKLFLNHKGKETKVDGKNACGKWHDSLPGLRGVNEISRDERKDWGRIVLK